MTSWKFCEILLILLICTHTLATSSPTLNFFSSRDHDDVAAQEDEANSSQKLVRRKLLGAPPLSHTRALTHAHSHTLTHKLAHKHSFTDKRTSTMQTQAREPTSQSSQSLAVFTSDPHISTFRPHSSMASLPSMTAKQNSPQKTPFFGEERRGKGERKEGEERRGGGEETKGVNVSPWRHDTLKIIHFIAVISRQMVK